MNHLLGFILLSFLTLPLVFHLYIGYCFNYLVAYLLPSGVENGAEFDFIVVGAGSAGSVVAGRLAEAGHQVLLVEAGGPSNWIQSVPALFLNSIGTPYDWAYKTEPQEHTMYAMNDRRSAWPRGKCLGGSSNLNNMLYVRGNPKDYDEWESFGNPGWKFEDVLPFFKKSEHFHWSEVNTKYHGVDGPLGVMEGKDLGGITKVFLEAGQELGYTIGDYNGEEGDKETLYVGQLSVKEGKRTGTYSAFAEPRVGRGLTVLTHAHVTKVTINEERVATGIEVERFGKTLNLKASKEIILSAGSIGSPTILMLSGVGPKEHLQSLNIQVVHDLPGVGENLQDHLFVSVGVYTEQDKLRIGGNPFNSVNPLNYFQYLTRGRGPLTSNGIEAGGFFSTEVNNDSLNRPDTQLLTLTVLYSTDYGVIYKKARNIADDSYNGAFKDLLDKDGAILNPSISRPKSRGYIRLRSSDPKEAPIIQPNYYSDPRDMETMVGAVKIAMKVIQTETFKKNKIYQAIDNHHCGHFEPNTDDYIRCYIQHWSFTIYHPAGTCKMGPGSDTTAVVDTELRVYGVQNLRVVDGSIMPTVVGGNTNAACIMIGEKGADMIISKWLKEDGFKSQEVPSKSEL